MKTMKRGETVNEKNAVEERGGFRSSPLKTHSGAHLVIVRGWGNVEMETLIDHRKRCAISA